MTTSSGHTTAILASKVKGTAVYNGAGDKIGTVEDIVLPRRPPTNPPQKSAAKSPTRSSSS